ncbi:MAG: preprotein translocase subunit SecG [Rhodospirillales bacterium]|jgi:preprotein translocase subunit SecG|nr:preprotein translocase subunit SecG [Rhodospirillales bacterium]
MINVLLVIHLFVAIALVAVVLLQRSEGGALGIGGSGGGMGGFLSGRSTANLLTRTTAILATVFIITSLTLTKLSARPERVVIPIEAPASGELLPVPPAAGPATPPSNEPQPPLAR